MHTVITGLDKDIEQLRTPEGCLYAGIPYFKGIFGRDSMIASWQLLRHDATIAQKSLEFVAQYQGKHTVIKSEEEPGKIFHVYNQVASALQQRVLKSLQQLAQGFPYYGSVDSTPLFVIVANEYFRKTGDKKLINDLWETIERAMQWIDEYGDLDGDGFVEYKRKNPFGLRNQNWKDTAIYLPMKSPVAPVEVQGYAYAAYKAANSLAMELNKQHKDWNARARELKNGFNSMFWMKDEGFLALALDGDKLQVKEIASNPGHLLFTGIIDKDKEARVVDRLFEDDMFTQYGLRTHSSLSKYFRRSCTLGAIWPHDNWMFWVGLTRSGYTNEADRIKNALLKAHQKLGYLPEYYDVEENEIVLTPRLARFIKVGKPCYPQAWATAALLDMLQPDSEIKH